MPKKHSNEDRNFDDLVPRFKRNIYDSPKGKIRLAILKRDFEQVVSNDLNGACVLDMGAGQGQFAYWLAQRGSRVTLADISEAMLSEAQQQFAACEFASSAEFVRCDLWQLPASIEQQQFDLVCNHAMLEWLESPMPAIDRLAARVRPRGFLSLLFYNVDGLIYKNLLRANYKKVLAGDVKGQKGSLTPLSPLRPGDVLEKLQLLGFEVHAYSGVRVFHDYILNRENRTRSFEQALELELKLSQQEPYRDLGRYIHLLAQKTEAL